MHVKINYKFFALVLGAIVVFTLGWYVTHRLQKKRLLGQYLEQAERAEDEKKHDRAARLLRAYVVAVPSDTDAKFRYGGLLERIGSSTRAKSDALSVYEQVLRQHPERTDARFRAAELAVELVRVSVAERHVSALVTSHPNDGRALFLDGLCKEAKKKYDEAEKAYERAYKVDPKVETFVRRATVLKVNLKHEDGVTGDGREIGPQAVLNELVAALPNAPQAYLARAAYHNNYTKDTGLARARSDLTVARKLAPDDVGVLLASSGVCVALAAKEIGTTEQARGARASLWNEARGYLTRAVALAQKDSQPPVALAELELRAGNRAEALKVLTAAQARVSTSDKAAVLFELAELHAEAGDRTAATAALEQLRKLKADPKRINLIEGVSLTRTGQWYAASGVLEQVRPLYATDSAATARISLLLGQCYGQLGDAEKQLFAYQFAVKSSPNELRPRLGLANTLAALGRTREAIAEYTLVTLHERSPVGAWLALARLLVYQNLSRPADARQWGEAERLIKAAKSAEPDSTEVPVLEAEVFAAKGDRDGAKKVLVAARDARPKEPVFWFALATLTDRAGDNDGAHRILDDAQKQIGDIVDLRVARLRVTAYTTAEAAERTLASLSADADRFSVDDRVRLMRVLAAAYWQIDRPAEAARLWDRVSEARPNELAVRLLRFDAALKANDDEGMVRLLAEIKRIEGNGALEKYGAATRLIWRAQRGDTSGLADARVLLAVAAGQRPGWSRVPLALARVDEFEGNTDRQLDHLRQAVDLGERSLSVIKQLARLLDERGRGREADELLRRLDSQSPLSNEMLQLNADVVLGFDVERALELARKAAKANSADPRERLWLARILSASARATGAGGKKEKANELRQEAVREYEAAVKLAPDRREVWIGYLGHAVRADGANREAVEPILKRAEVALDKDPLALAVCYELTGDRKRAEERYLAAKRANPADAATAFAISAFYQGSGQPEKAEPFLRQLLQPDTKASPEQLAWARRNLALALGLRPENPAVAEALRLLDDNAKVTERAEDLRTRALIRAAEPGRRREVIALLEKAERLNAPGAEHELLLARCYETEGNWEKARGRFLALIGIQKDKARYLELFARALIRHGELSFAAERVAQLAELAPNAIGTVELRVELACRHGRAGDALSVLEKFVTATDGPKVAPDILALAVAQLYERAHWSGAGGGSREAAERYYAKYKELAKRPEAALELAAYLGRVDSPDRALALCAEALKAGVSVERVVRTALSALSGQSVRAVDFELVEGWIAKARATKPSADHAFLLGTLREQQKQYGAAEAEYAKVLAAVPTHAGALNNVSFLLAMRGRGTEAVGAAARAIAATPVAPPELLDTRAVALTAAGDLDGAKRELEAVVAQEGSPVAQFHLAVVYDRLKDPVRALAALKVAKNTGLRVGTLHPLERQQYLDLCAKLKP